MNERIDPVDKLVALHEDFIGPPSGVQPDAGKPARSSAKKKLITTLTLTSNTCRWPFGDPASPDFHYCGQVPQQGGIYCDTHDSMSRPPSQRRKSS